MVATNHQHLLALFKRPRSIHHQSPHIMGTINRLNRLAGDEPGRNTNRTALILGLDRGIALKLSDRRRKSFFLFVLGLGNFFILELEVVLVVFIIILF